MDDLFKKVETLIKNLENIKNLWIYKDKVIVLDTEINTNKIAFDITPDFKDNSLKIEMFSRNQEKSLITFEKEVISFSKYKYLIFKGQLNMLENIVEVINNYLKKLKLVNVKFQDILTDKRLVNQELKSENKELIKIRNIPNSIKYKFTIIDVLNRQMCIGCGACNIVSEGKIKIDKNNYGIYEANLKDIENLNEEDFTLANSVCPFSNMSLNENQLDVPNVFLEIYLIMKILEDMIPYLLQKKLMKTNY